MKLKCIIIDDEPHAISELEDLVNQSPTLVLANSFPDVNPAIAWLQENKFVDIVFSDINMPSINGIDSAKILKKYCQFLVFATAHREFALDAFNVSASAYLVKPISKINFLEKIDELINSNASAELATTNQNDILFIKGGAKNSFIRIKFNEIVFIEGMLNYIVIHTVNDKHITYMSLKEIMAKLEHTGLFIRINKSIIISANFVSHIDGFVVHLTNNKYQTVGNAYKSAFQKYISKRTLNNG